MYEWPIDLDVGSQGKKYNIWIELRNSSGVYKKSATLPIFVDDCAARDRKIEKLILDSKNGNQVFDHEDFRQYLRLVLAVEKGLCKAVKNGLIFGGLPIQALKPSVDNRCHVQCINSVFAKEVIELTRTDFFTATNVVQRAHRNVWIRSSDPLKNVAGDYFFLNLMEYIDAEDFLRAKAYLNCGGSLTANDRERSVAIIRAAFDSVAYTGILGGTIGDRLFGGLFGIDYHLNRTENLYRDRIFK